MSEKHSDYFFFFFREQRVTALGIGILSGCAVLITSVLKVNILFKKPVRNKNVGKKISAEIIRTYQHVMYDVSSFYLQYIPMPVLYGVFFYMGFSALRGMQVRGLFFFQNHLEITFYMYVKQPNHLVFSIRLIYLTLTKTLLNVL